MSIDSAIPIRIAKTAKQDVKRENSLIHRAVAGDRSACDELVRANYQQVYRMLVHLSHDPDRAADITQDVFVTAWKKLHQFEQRSSFKTWLNRIAYTTYIDAKRKQTTRDKAKQKLEHDFRPSQSKSPITSAVDSENSQRIYTAVQQLPESERTVVALHYFQGLSLAETASVLARPVGTVKWQNSQAIKRLKKLLG